MASQGTGVCTDDSQRAAQRLAVRWTIGDVSLLGFEALRLSVWGMWRLFGADAQYVVCTNSIPTERARGCAGDLPDGVLWRDADAEVPDFLRAHLDEEMAEGVAWKLAPLRVCPDRHELSLDNDCIVWAVPAAVYQWLDDGDDGACLLARDVRCCYGQFAEHCGSEPLNSGIRGLAPRFPLQQAMQKFLQKPSVVLRSEIDEQGLQVAALRWAGTPRVVGLDEVSICSPFPPHVARLGSCGAHFVGLNVRRSLWSLKGRPALEYIREHWLRHRPALYRRVGIRPLQFHEKDALRG